MKILNVHQMTEIDRLSTEQYGISSLLLMENAGIQVYLTLEETFGQELRSRRIAVICGRGNNGGDGFVVARQLFQRGIHPDVFLLAKKEDVNGDAGVNLNICLKSGLPVEEITSDAAVHSLQERLAQSHIIVDAILGTGLRTPLGGLYAAVVESINSSQAFVVAVDVPSGMFSDRLLKAPLTVTADITVTFTAPKIAHILGRDQEAIGVLKIVPIGSPEALLSNPEHKLNLLDSLSAAQAIPRRRSCSHKGDFGHVALLSGSRGKSGAAILGALAALKSGAGLVTACVPESVQGWVAASHPELMTEGLPSTDTGSFSSDGLGAALDALRGKDAAAIGPGVSTHPDTVAFVRELVGICRIPLIIDADGLNAFEGSPDLIINADRPVTVLTPHPGEFARLQGRTVSEVSEAKLELAGGFAEKFGVWMVLKDFRTLVADPTGQIYVCPLGNPGMATAGMGDVLTGMITSLVGQLSARGGGSINEVTKAVSAAVYLHSLAGDLAAAKVGQPALTAGRVIDSLGKAFCELLSSSS